MKQIKKVSYTIKLFIKQIPGIPIYTYCDSYLKGEYYAKYSWWTNEYKIDYKTGCKIAKEVLKEYSVHNVLADNVQLNIKPNDIVMFFVDVDTIYVEELQ